MKIKKKLPGILGDIILLITAVFCVLPFIYMLLMSLKSTVNAYDFSISLSEITLEQYVKIFTKNPQNVLTRQMLLERLWDIDENFVDEHALTVAVSRVRNKIETNGLQYIKTVYGMGYMWVGGVQK